VCIKDGDALYAEISPSLFVELVCGIDVHALNHGRAVGQILRPNGVIFAIPGQAGAAV
jgi:hypothetical protein